jgi:hypothetical protein
MAELWSDNADFIIGSMDKETKTKYGLQLSDLLTTPTDFVTTENILLKISNMKEDVEKKTESVLAGMQDEVKKAHDDFARADSATSQLAQMISVEAKKDKVPLIATDYLARQDNSDEVIYVTTVESWVGPLVEKFVSISDYVADLTVAHDKYKLGSWLFSGKKPYLISVRVQQSPVLTIEESCTEVLSLLDGVATMLKSMGVTK